MDSTVLPIKKNAGPIWLIDKRKAAAIGAEPGVALDKVILL